MTVLTDHVTVIIYVKLVGMAVILFWKLKLFWKLQCSGLILYIAVMNYRLTIKGLQKIISLYLTEYGQNLGKTTRDTTHKTAISFTRTGRWKRTVVIFRAVKPLKTSAGVLTTSYPGLVANWWQRRSPGKRWSRVRQILQDSWSISLRSGFMEIKTGGRRKVHEWNLNCRGLFIFFYFLL